MWFRGFALQGHGTCIRSSDRQQGSHAFGKGHPQPGRRVIICARPSNREKQALQHGCPYRGLKASGLTHFEALSGIGSRIHIFRDRQSASPDVHDPTSNHLGAEPESCAVSSAASSAALKSTSQSPATIHQSEELSHFVCIGHHGNQHVLPTQSHCTYLVGSNCICRRLVRGSYQEALYGLIHRGGTRHYSSPCRAQDPGWITWQWIHEYKRRVRNGSGDVMRHG